MGQDGFRTGRKAQLATSKANADTLAQLGATLQTIVRLREDLHTERSGAPFGENPTSQRIE